jgi:cellulose biosynthesis protein BcsQ
MNNEIENIISHIQPFEDSLKVNEYIEKLEQQLTDLKESQKQKQIIRLCNRLDKAEQQNKQMIELLKFISEYFDKGHHSNLCEAIFNKDIKELLK